MRATALLQKAVKIPRARFVAAEHQHAAARGKIVLHVRGGGLKLPPGTVRAPS